MNAERLLATYENRDDRFTVGRVVSLEGGEKVLRYLVVGPEWWTRAAVTLAMRPPMDVHCAGEASSAACIRKAPALGRVWCRELSVLDCEVDGERWVFHVPARAANDDSCADSSAPSEPKIAPAAKAAGPRRRGTLTDWLRSEVSP